MADKGYPHRRRAVQAQPQQRGRIVLAVVAFLLVYAAITGRLVQLGFAGPADTSGRLASQERETMSRPDLVDRNGELLATDIAGLSLFAEPRHIVNADEATAALLTVFPELDAEKIKTALSRDTAFAWIKREISPDERDAVHRLGIPGLYFRTENRRYYPSGPVASHILGTVSVDNRGLFGLEKYLDRSWLKDLNAAGFGGGHEFQPVELSVDLRVQSVVRAELETAMERYRAIAAMGIVLDVHTGEVVSMVSLPDFDPNLRTTATKRESRNRVTSDAFEMGSVFKVFNHAMALDSSVISINDSFDATNPLRIGGHSIGDFHGKKRWLTVPEVFIYSSNIGSGRMALKVGRDNQQEFLGRLGLLSTVDTELPEVVPPVVPRTWRDVTAVTISYGHGLSVSPMQTAVATAAVVNGGKLIPPTFFPRSREAADMVAKQVLNPYTSQQMRDLMAMNAREGSGGRARVEGYEVGGKTGTAEKITNGQYDSSKRFNSYLSAFPISDPRYVVLVVLDEPKPEKPGGYATAGLNASPTVGRIVRRIGPMLGVVPRPESDVTLAAAQ